MKYFPLIWTALWRRPVRTALTFLSLAAAFLLFGSLYGLNAAFEAAIARVSSNRLIVYSASYGPAMPIAYKSAIEQIPGVVSTMISTEISAYYQQPQNLLYVAAIGGRIHLDMFGDIENAGGLVTALQSRRTGALVGRSLANRFGFKVGDRVSLITGPERNRDGSDFMLFDIVGIYDTPGSPESAHWFLLNYDYLEEVRVKALGTTNELYVDTKDPSENEQVAGAIDQHFETAALPTNTESYSDFQHELFNQTIDMKLLVMTILVASLFSLLVLAANTMMQSVQQRLAELAMMKAVGYSGPVVALFVFVEAALLCVAAAALGLLAAVWIFPKLATAVQIPSIRMPLQVPVVGVLLALLVAWVSSIVPAWRVNRLSPARILAGN